jgi:hemoglobin
MKLSRILISRSRSRSMALALALVALGAAACGGKPMATAPPASAGSGSGSASLYDRLGRKDAITAVVKDFVEQRVAKDARINAFFAHADLADLEAKLADQICEASGGPCKYTGKDMRTAHAGMNVKDGDFHALVEDLQASLDHFHVAARDQQDLLGALAGMHDDIVTAK